MKNLIRISNSFIISLEEFLEGWATGQVVGWVLLCIQNYDCAFRDRCLWEETQ